MFNNLRELITSMPDEKQCREYLAKQRWPDGNITCPYCQHGKCYVIENGERFKCANSECYKRFTVVKGTVMEASNIPVSKWLTAIYLVTAHKKGISSYQLGRDLGLSQKSGWFMLHRIREMLKGDLTRKLDNVCEADEMYVGGSIANKHISVRKKYQEEGNNWQKNKSTVLGIIERGGEAMATVVDSNDTKATIVNTIQENISHTAHVVTDTHNYYATLSNDYSHATVNHSANEFIVGNNYTNSIEGMFSHFKRMVFGIYHQISKQHTQRYLDEFIMRWNSRKMKDAARFQYSFKNVHRRLTYKELIALSEPKEVKSLPYAESKRFNYLRKRILQVQGDEVIGEFKSGKEAANATGITASNISSCLTGRRKSAGGFKWVYA